MIEHIMTARNAILDDLKRRFKEGDKTVSPLNPVDAHRWFEPTKQRNCFSGAGVMDCPICKTGKLKYTRSGYNGHAWGACTTEGCVRWME